MSLANTGSTSTTTTAATSRSVDSAAIVCPSSDPDANGGSIVAEQKIWGITEENGEVGERVNVKNKSVDMDGQVAKGGSEVINGEGGVKQKARRGKRGGKKKNKNKVEDPTGTFPELTHPKPTTLLDAIAKVDDVATPAKQPGIENEEINDINSNIKNSNDNDEDGDTQMTNGTSTDDRSDRVDSGHSQDIIPTDVSATPVYHFLPESYSQPRSSVQNKPAPTSSIPKTLDRFSFNLTNFDLGDNIPQFPTLPSWPPLDDKEKSLVISPELEQPLQVFFDPCWESSSDSTTPSLPSVRPNGATEHHSLVEEARMEVTADAVVGDNLPPFPTLSSWPPLDDKEKSLVIGPELEHPPQVFDPCWDSLSDSTTPSLPSVRPDGAAEHCSLVEEARMEVIPDVVDEEDEDEYEFEDVIVEEEEEDEDEYEFEDVIVEDQEEDEDEYEFEDAIVEDQDEKEEEEEGKEDVVQEEVEVEVKMEVEEEDVVEEEKEKEKEEEDVVDDVVEVEVEEEVKMDVQEQEEDVVEEKEEEGEEEEKEEKGVESNKTCFCRYLELTCRHDGDDKDNTPPEPQPAEASVSTSSLDSDCEPRTFQGRVLYSSSSDSESPEPRTFQGRVLSSSSSDSDSSEPRTFQGWVLSSSSSDSDSSEPRTFQGWVLSSSSSSSSSSSVCPSPYISPLSSIDSSSKPNNRPRVRAEFDGVMPGSFPASGFDSNSNNREGTCREEELIDDGGHPINNQTNHSIPCTIGTGTADILDITTTPYPKSLNTTDDAFPIKTTIDIPDFESLSPGYLAGDEASPPTRAATTTTTTTTTATTTWPDSDTHTTRFGIFDEPLTNVLFPRGFAALNPRVRNIDDNEIGKNRPDGLSDFEIRDWFDYMGYKIADWAREYAKSPPDMAADATMMETEVYKTASRLERVFMMRNTRLFVQHLVTNALWRVFLRDKMWLARAYFEDGLLPEAKFRWFMGQSHGDEDEDLDRSALLASVAKSVDVFPADILREWFYSSHHFKILELLIPGGSRLEAERELEMLYLEVATKSLDIIALGVAYRFVDGTEDVDVGSGYGDGVYSYSSPYMEVANFFDFAYTDEKGWKRADGREIGAWVRPALLLGSGRKVENSKVWCRGSVWLDID